ncbi:hypothetical protein QUC31_011695 [Theobroma cacao]|uniref:Transcription factor bHLH53 n=2 Tax=Theobroma cacao TaxID=3641 RepID=A0AB32WLB8_THECC|nr:PREDICTED: transcription factor bHLH53 [Theobroma cacao]EOY25650.1 Basic helix-loop-helix DNA-binding superfamily protein, putative [Theobroma cacao]WRX26207.1 Myc-type [Theobroma cacao]
MALSYCSNCLKPEISSFQQAEKELAGDYHLDSVSGFDSSLALLDTFIDPFLQPGGLLFSDGYTNLLPSLSSPPEYIISSFPPEEFEFELCQEYPKRQKNVSNYYCSNFGANFLAGFVPNSAPGPAATDLFLPKIPVPLPEFEPEMPTFNCENENAKKTSPVSVSNLQSIAARQRRRKITDKTQELGKLIPGGHKMRTAEMLRAAYKYVNFLQAQVGVLEAMWSFHQGKEEALMHSQELPNLLASQAIQEKLYSEEKCLIPKDFVQTLANDYQIQSKPLIIEEINRILLTS